MTSTPNDYWNQDIPHCDQKFYTAFCILQSAISDYSIACDLRSRNCLNWSATAYYYSMVHASRLICFLAVGDYPMNHQKLASLFSGTDQVWTSWLTKFNRTPGTETSRSIISNFYSNNSLQSEQSLESIGQILSQSCNCRNDSNYEMLLMAHELNHQFVSPSFKSLTKSLNAQSESIIPFAIEAFKIFIDTNGGTQNQRSDYWYSYLNWNKWNEGLSHIIKFIRYRLQDNVRSEVRTASPNRIQLTKSTIRKIEQWIQPLKLPLVNDDYANEVFENIKYGTFIGKQNIMHRFSDAVNELKELSVFA